MAVSQRGGRLCGSRSPPGPSSPWAQGRADRVLEFLPDGRQTKGAQSSPKQSTHSFPPCSRILPRHPRRSGHQGSFCCQLLHRLQHPHTYRMEPAPLAESMVTAGAHCPSHCLPCRGELPLTPAAAATTDFACCSDHPHQMGPTISAEGIQE